MCSASAWLNMVHSALEVIDVAWVHLPVCRIIFLVIVVCMF